MARQYTLERIAEVGRPKLTACLCILIVMVAKMPLVFGFQLPQIQRPSLKPQTLNPET